MPLRKQGTIVKTALVASFLGCALIPATADAGILSGLLAPKTPTPTPKAVATPKPAATPTAKVVATPTPTPKATATPTPAATTTGSTVTSAAVPAATGCTQLPTTKAFKGVDGDDADYSIAPGGNFESGTAGWTFTGGARIASNVNENLGVSGGSHALVMPLTSTATSPAFCVDESNPHFRFVYKVDNAVLTGFVAYVIYRDAQGKVTNIELVSSQAISLTPSLWQASPKSPLATLIPLNSTSKTASVQLKLTALSPADLVKDASTAIIGDNAAVNAVTGVVGSAAGVVGTITGLLGPATNIGVTVDSVMVDPYRRG